MKTKINYAVVLLSVFMFFTSCYFTSVNPITTPAESVIDERLLGAWALVPEKKERNNEQGEILFLKHKERFLRIIIIINGKEIDGEYVGFCSSVKDRRFLNVQSTSYNEISGKMDKDETYTLVYYTVNKNELVTRMLNEDLIKKLIKEKKLRGTVETAQYGDSVEVTDTADNLKNLVMNETLENLTDKDILFKAVKRK